MKLLRGDCLEMMKLIPDGSVDSVVTDPPYGLGFMGHKWDYDIPSTEVWAECLRVLKPGGHLLAFAGTRTQHRMAVRIEDAGFEIRDMIAWVYGTGFPKSADISKGIDKINGSQGMAVRKDIAKLIGLSGMSDKAIAEEAGVSAALVRFWRREERNIMPEQSRLLKGILGNADLAMAERDFISQAKGSIGRGSWRKMEGRDDQMPESYAITAPSTDEAKKWEGWGTALKPSMEPITVARKPLATRNVAVNVMTLGAGALNIGSSRVGERWPSNLIHDGLEAADILGDAARFFYCAKVDKKDRGGGNDHPTVKPTGLMAYLCRLVTPMSGTVLDPFMGSGSTGKAAIREGFEFIGIERDDKYFAIAQKRIEDAMYGDLV